MRSREDGGARQGARVGREERQGEPVSPHAYTIRSTSVSRYYENYRERADPPPRHPNYEDYRRGGPNSPPLRRTFRREPHEDRNDVQDRHYNDPDEDLIRRHNRPAGYVANFSSAAPVVDERRSDKRKLPDHYSPPLPRSTSSALQPTPSLTHPHHFSNMKWVKPAATASLPKAHARTESNGVKDIPIELFPRSGNPPVDVSVKQSPHIFIPARDLPLKHSTISYLENSRAKSVPTKTGERHVFMDDTGYFVTFPNSKEGRYQQELWLRTNERLLVLGKHRLDSMTSYPSGQGLSAASPPSTGRSLADTAAPKERRRGSLNEEAANPDTSFSIRGAASVGPRRTVAPRDSNGSAGESEFAIKGAASSPSARSPTETAFDARKSQAPRPDLFSLPHVPGKDLLPKKIRLNGDLQPHTGNAPMQDRDDAASSSSGFAGSDISGSKHPECHVCKARTGSLIKCSTCNRRYHRHCHANPPIPQHLSDEWQCGRCKRKSVPLKRNTSQTSSPALGQTALKKQRLSYPETINAHVVEPAIIPEIAHQNVINDQGTSALPRDDEADDLVAESFAPATAGAPKKGGKLKDIIKHRKSLPELTNSGSTSVVESTASIVDHTALSTSGPQLGNTHARSISDVEGLKVQAPEIQNAETETATTSHNALPLQNSCASAPLPIGDRAAHGKRGKKMNRNGKTKCTSCKIHVVPSNPFGTTICQPCVEMRTSLGPKAGEPQNKPGAMSDVQSGVLETAQAGPNMAQAGPPIAQAEDGCETIPEVEAVPVVPAAPARLQVAANAEGKATQSPTAAPVAAADPKDAEYEPQPDEEFPASSSSNDSSDSTDEDDDDEDVPLSTLRKRALNPKLGDRPSLPAKKTTRQTQRVKAKDQYDLGDSSKRPKGTYARLIHMAIADAPEGRLKGEAITQWISNNIPGYRLGEGIWAGGVKSTLIFRSDPSGKNGVPTLRRHVTDEGEFEYGLLPGWKDKVDRWDAVLAQPISPFATDRKTTPLARRPASPEGSVVEKSPSKLTKPTSTGTLKSIKKVKNRRGKQPAQPIPLSQLMDFTSDSGDGDDVNMVDDSSVEEPLAQQMGVDHQLEPEDMDIDDVFDKYMENLPRDEPLQTGTDRHSAADNADIDELFAETTPVQETIKSTGRKKSWSVHDLTVEQVLACRPAATQTELYKAWPSLDPKKTEIDYERKKAEIKARPKRKDRINDRISKGRPVDVEKVLATVGPSKGPQWPPIDNSLGMTREQLGDDLMTIEPVETWDEFWGTTEEVKPCIIDGKLAYRPVGGKSRAVYKTSI